jgi:hypothetical protein
MKKKDTFDPNFPPKNPSESRPSSAGSGANTTSSNSVPTHRVEDARPDPEIGDPV